MESSVEAQYAINAKLPIAGLLIVLLLVMQFDSIRRPLIILATITLGFVPVLYAIFFKVKYKGFTY